jgi:WD40 repeat protein
MSDGKEYFLSCSDDDTVRVYDPKDDKFELLTILNTKFITEWHTLTYMSMEEKGSHVAVVSENGYLFVWDMFDNYKLIYSRHIHGGSLEALAWREDSLICCSSDCCFSTIKFNYTD